MTTMSTFLPGEGAEETEAARSAARAVYGVPDAVRELWQEAPVREFRAGDTADGRDGWLVTGMREVRGVLSDPRFSRAEARRIGAVDELSTVSENNAPAGARLRHLLAKSFSARRSHAPRARVQQLTDGLIRPLLDAGPPADLVTGLCRPLPLLVVFDVLGCPPQDLERVGGWAERVTATDTHPPEESQRAFQAIIGYMTGLVEAKRREPDDSLLRELVTACDDQGWLSERELIHSACGLLLAGNETTATVLGKGLLALLDHPEQLAALRADPSLLPAAVEEVLRYVPLSTRPYGGQVRATTCDVELGGATIPAHSAVFANSQAANLDPEAFADPTRFDITRAGAAQHVTFGYGPHYCLGAQLARTELEVAFGSVLAAFPGLRLTVPAAELPPAPGGLVVGLRELPVTW